MHTGFVGETLGKRPLGIPRRTSDDNIEMDHQEVGWGIDWIHLLQNRDTWRALMNAIMNLRVMLYTAKFLSG